MELRLIYDPVLRTKARPVEQFDQALKKLAEGMIPVMRAHNGLGLAAPQVGVSRRLIVLGYEPTGPDDELPRIPYTALVNPRVVRSSQEKETVAEGCLSLPGLELPVTRSVGVTVAAQTLDGEAVSIKAKGLVARILQHEIDHLDGILFTDRAESFSNIADYRYARIVFFGSDDFSLPVFTALLEEDLNVIAAITETDKPAGRGKTLQSPLMKREATKRGVAVFQPEDKRQITALLADLDPDLIILASYGKILPAEALAEAVFGALNVHPSLLPKYRGATPIQSALLAGEKETGVTIMSMVPEVDAGGMIVQEKAAIEPSDTSVSLRTRLAHQGAKMLIRTIPSYLAGQAKMKTQDEAEVTKTAKLTKEMAEIDWSRPLQEIDRQVRALQPWPSTFTWLGDKRLKILASELVEGKLALRLVQLEGKAATNWDDFCRGYGEALKKTDWYAKIS